MTYGLLRKPEIAGAIADAERECPDGARLTAEWILERLQFGAKGGGPDTNSAARAGALDVPGRHLASSMDRHEVTPRTAPREISDEDLAMALRDVALLRAVTVALGDACVT